MKKILSLVIMTACLAGCGSAARVSPNENTVDVGYGVQDQDKVTTAVSKRDAQTYSSMYDYLRGRVAGVMVTTDNRIIIRGIGTNSDATDPLILVDGVETTDLSGINPTDVESVDVIKDGSSSIYGMRGANGVIIIKTGGSH